MDKEKIYYIYVLRCLDNSLYTGITTDVKRRFGEHSQSGKLGAKYTRSRKPVSIEAVWACSTRSDASKLEYAFKKLKKAQKELIVKDVSLFDKVFCEKLDVSMYKYVDEYKDFILK